MAMPTNGTLKKIITSVAAGVFLMVLGAILNSALTSSTALAGDVRENSRRISVIEERLSGFAEALSRCSTEIKENRKEASDERKDIMNKLDRLIEQKAVAKRDQ